jgi:hypothetical protein
MTDAFRRSHRRAYLAESQPPSEAPDASLMRGNHPSAPTAVFGVLMGWLRTSCLGWGHALPQDAFIGCFRSWR